MRRCSSAKGAPTWASSREEMPVIDDKNVKPAADALAAGEIDWAEPNVQAQAAANRKDDLIPESVRRKWGKLIK